MIPSDVYLWPGAVVLVPPVRRCQVQLLADRRLRIGGELEAQELPNEFVLRQLLDLDLSEHPVSDTGFDRLVDFVAAYGLPEFSPRADTFSAAKIAGSIGRLAELVKFWINQVESPDQELTPDDPTWAGFIRDLDRGLARIHGSAAVGGPHPIDLYAACCLQLQNLLVEVSEGLPLHRCHNERCGRAFVRQHEEIPDRTKYRTKGLMYCSIRCARNTAKREFKRRQKEESP